MLNVMFKLTYRIIRGIILLPVAVGLISLLNIIEDNKTINNSETLRGASAREMIIDRSDMTYGSN
jgi:hypothetical protein